MSSDTATKESADSQPASGDIDVKHPLEHRWSLWFLRANSEKSWSENLKQVHTVGTVEDFWSLFNYILPAGHLNRGCDYSFFKEGIMPQWEDNQNREGGRWVLSISKIYRDEVNKYWLETLLTLIGEGFEGYGDYVNGAVVSIRPKGDRLALWLSVKNDADTVMGIGKIFKARLGLNTQVILNFQAHDDAMTRQSSSTKNMYSL